VLVGGHRNGDYIVASHGAQLLDKVLYGFGAFILGACVVDYNSESIRHIGFSRFLPVRDADILVVPIEGVDPNYRA
jgi:hypothetical protein